MAVTFSQLIHWLSMHGAGALFILLALGVFGLPVPGETLLIISGVLLAEQVMSLPATLILAPIGAMMGITVSYFLGRLLSKTLVHTLMRKFKVDTKHWDTMEQWNQRYGKWSLTIGYFVPGVRHFTGIFAGLLELSYLQFAAFAYLGATLWCAIFLALGYYFGQPALTMLHNIYMQYGYSFIVLCSLLLLSGFAYGYLRYKR